MVAAWDKIELTQLTEADVGTENNLALLKMLFSKSFSQVVDLSDDANMDDIGVVVVLIQSNTHVRRRTSNEEVGKVIDFRIFFLPRRKVFL